MYEAKTVTYYSEVRTFTLSLSRIRGVQGLKVWEHNFKITSDPKGPEVSQLFGRVLGPQTLRRRRGCHTHFPIKKGPRN